MSKGVFAVTGHTALPPCCAPTAVDPCNGKILPTEDKDRGKDYNHSTFLDLIISGIKEQLSSAHGGCVSKFLVCCAFGFQD